MYYTNDDSMFRREQAKELYLWSDKTQKQIGETVGVSDRTIRQWIKQFRWNELKYHINHPPATFTEGIRIELTNLQSHILTKDCGFPNKDEVNTMHRLILCLQKLTILPQHDQTTQLPVISNPETRVENSLTEGKSADILACPLEFIPNETSGEGADRRSGGGTIDNTPDNLPDSQEKVSSAFVDNSQTILPPLTENQSLDDVLPPSKSGTEAEVKLPRAHESQNIGTNNKSAGICSESIAEPSGSETEEPSGTLVPRAHEHAIEKSLNDASNKSGGETDIPLCPPSKGEDMALPCQRDVNTPEQTENIPSPEVPLSAPQSPLSSEEPPLTYREKIWELMKKEAKEKGLWQPRGLPSDLLEPGTPEWEEREKKRRAAIERTKDEMRREQYRYKRRNDW